MMKRVILSLFLILTLWFNLLANTNREGKDYALFFAVDNYQDEGWTDLRNPVRDAQAIANELEENFQFETTVYKNSTKEEIYDILFSWQQRFFPEDGQVFIFFSGHGTFKEAFKEGYFVPADGKANDPYNDSYIELSRIGRIITGFSCNHILLGIDACYSGTIDQEIAFRGRLGQRPGESKTDQRQQFINRQLRNKSRLLITSGGKERTPDGKDHSPFSQSILDALQNTYTMGDGLLTFQDLLGQLEHVSPVPHYGELPGHKNGSFVFISGEMAKPAATPRAEEQHTTITEPLEDPQVQQPIRLTPVNTTPIEDNATYGKISFNSGRGVIRHELRHSPTRNDIGREVLEGTIVKILDTRYNEGMEWYEVEYEGKIGWIESRFVKQTKR